MTHLPILQVILPLLGAPLCVIIKQPRLVWAFSLLVSALALAVSVLLLQQVLDVGVISYELGGWEPPWGIEYRIDSLNAWVLLIVSGLGTLVLLGALKSIEREVPEAKRTLFYVCYLLCLAGLLGMTATGDIFNVFVFLEISSLSTYALIAFGSDRRATWASYQYLIMGTIGATFFLIGVGFLYLMTGTLNMQDLAMRLPAIGESHTVMTGFAFIVVGLCLKLALFPLHLWLPNAYAFAPSIATAFIAATSTKVAVYLLIRITYTVFGNDFPAPDLPLSTIFLLLGLIGVISASLVAIYQTNVKRLLAYSSVAQIGYMIVGLGLANVAGLQAALLHLFNHALMKGALFMALAGVMYRVGSVEITAMRGLGRRMPWTMAAIVIGGFSLIGVPLTVGLVSKWYLVIGALEAGLWPVVFLIALGSLLAVIYIWRIIEAAYFQAPAEGEGAPRDEAPLSLLVPTWILVLANIYLGIDTRLTVSVTETAARFLLGGAP